MSVTIQQMIEDARNLVKNLSAQGNTASELAFEIQCVNNQIESTKQYQEDIETLNAQCNHNRQDIISRFQTESNGYYKELVTENRDLRLALEDYQTALEQIMSKYRQQTAYFLKQTKTDFTTLQNKKCCANHNQCKYINMINRQFEKIKEMSTVMRTAAQIDENELKYLEILGQLQEENLGLREILSTVNKYNIPKNEVSVENKTVQTDEL